MTIAKLRRTIEDHVVNVGAYFTSDSDADVASDLEMQLHELGHVATFPPHIQGLLIRHGVNQVDVGNGIRKHKKDSNHWERMATAIEILLARELAPSVADEVQRIAQLTLPGNLTMDHRTKTEHVLLMQELMEGPICKRRARFMVRRLREKLSSLP